MCLSQIVGDDFQGSIEAVTFPALASPGAEQCATINITDDNLVEDTESFTVTAGAGAFPNGNVVTVSIMDNDGETLDYRHLATIMFFIPRSSIWV